MKLPDLVQAASRERPAMVVMNAALDALAAYGKGRRRRISIGVVMSGRAAGTLKLMWWLGAPWMTRAFPRAPTGTAVTTGPGLAHRFWPSADPNSDTTLVMIPGLHMDGPADSRMDRLGRIFATAGMHVVAPVIPAFEGLWIRDDRHSVKAPDAAIAASDWARTWLGARRQVVFSVSFGSVVAMHLMAARDIARGVFFGGLASLDTALRFALDRDGNPGRDPLNGPAIYRNFANAWFEPTEAARFEAACSTFCHATWSRSARPALKARGQFVHALDAAGRELSVFGRELLHEAVGLRPDAVSRIEATLGAIQPDANPFAWADPRHLAARVTAPVDCIHGRDDDVIPASSAAQLAAMMPNARAWLTGRWTHTGASEGGASGFLDEVSNNVGIFRAISLLRMG